MAVCGLNESELSFPSLSSVLPRRRRASNFRIFFFLAFSLTAMTSHVSYARFDVPIAKVSGPKANKPTFSSCFPPSSLQSDNHLPSSSSTRPSTHHDPSIPIASADVPSTASQIAQLFTLVGQIQQENQAQASAIAVLSSENKDQEKVIAHVSKASIPGGH